MLRNPHRLRLRRVPLRGPWLRRPLRLAPPLPPSRDRFALAALALDCGSLEAALWRARRRGKPRRPWQGPTPRRVGLSLGFGCPRDRSRHPRVRAAGNRDRSLGGLLPCELSPHLGPRVLELCGLLGCPRRGLPGGGSVRRSDPTGGPLRKSRGVPDIGVLGTWMGGSSRVAGAPGPALFGPWGGDAPGAISAAVTGRFGPPLSGHALVPASPAEPLSREVGLRRRVFDLACRCRPLGSRLSDR